MPYILGLIGLVTAAYFLVIRARNAAEMTNELAGVASDVMAAARRFGFRRRKNLHPVESIDDPNLAMGGLGVAFMQIGGSPTEQQKNGFLVSLQSRLGVTVQEAEELDVLGQWFVMNATARLRLFLGWRNDYSSCPVRSIWNRCLAS